MPLALRALPARARLFFWSVLGASGCLLAVIAVRGNGAVVLWETMDTAAPILLAASALVFLARLFPIAFAGGDKFTVTFRLDGVVLFAAILLLAETEAAMVAALGVGTHQVYVHFKKRERWYLLVFNTAQQILVVGLSALAFRSLASGAVPPLGSSKDLLPIFTAVLVYFLVNTGLTSTMLAFIRSRRPWEVWIEAHRWTWHFYLSHLALGVFVADLYLTVPLAVPLAFLMVAVLRHAYASIAIIRNQTVETIEMLADTVDRRDPYTFQHSLRVADYCRLIGQRLELPAEEVDAIVQAARVHDVGKIAVSDIILQKAGPLSREEREEINKHSQVGAQIVGKLPQYARGREYILYHHERYDGGGTFRKQGREIPLGARIMAVADSFDAMTSDRPYRVALDRSAAIAELIRHKGRQFDPVVAEAFVTALREQEEREQLRGGSPLDTLVPVMPLHIPAGGTPAVRH